MKPKGVESRHSFDELKQLIQAVVEQTKGLNLQPSADDAEILSLAKQFDALEGTYQELLERVKQIEIPHETQSLHQQLNQIEMVLEQYAKILSVCEQFLVLQKEIEQSISMGMEQIRDLGQLSPEQAVPQGFYLILETLYDACDLYADQLDEIENKQLDITSVSGRYEKLVLLVQVLQDHLDEL